MNKEEEEDWERAARWDSAHSGKPWRWRMAQPHMLSHAGQTEWNWAKEVKFLVLITEQTPPLII